jgi:hypothetical protein
MNQGLHGLYVLLSAIRTPANKYFSGQRFLPSWAVQQAYSNGGKSRSET